MADEASSEDKTEHVSARRTREAWDKGRIPLGKDVAGVAGLLATLGALSAVGPRLEAGLLAVTSQGLRHGAEASLADVLHLAAEPLALCALVLAAPAAAAALTTVAQTRGGLWPELALPDFQRLGHGRLTQAFTRQFWVDMALVLLKVTVVGAVAWGAVRDDLLTLPHLLALPPDAQLTAVFRPLSHLAVRVVAVMALFAGADLALAHLRFREKMKMTREEAKRELKEDEGDPLLKGRRKRRARELARGRIAVEVPRADALVVNPTHIAIAIRYRKDEGGAPRVIAKGKGQAAENMRELARAHGVPIVEDIPLARLLFKRVKVGGSIPAETYKAVAAILAFVYRVTGRVPQRAAAGGAGR